MKTFEQNVQDLFNDQFFKQTKNIKEKGLTLKTSIKARGYEEGYTVEQRNIANHLGKIMKRYSVSLEFYNSEDIIQEYAAMFIQAAYELQTLEEMRILKSNPETYKIRLGFIKQYIDRQFSAVANPASKAIKTKNGRKYIEVKEELILNAPMNANNPDGKSILDSISENEGIFKGKERTPNHFITWVLNNHSDILTNKQDEIFVKLLDCYQPLTDRSAETLAARKEMLEEIGISNTHVDRTFKAIKKRCLTAYNKEFTGMQSHTTEQSQKFHELLNGYVSAANDYKHFDPLDRQIELTKMIVDNYDNEDFEVVIIKGLKTEDIVNIVRAYKGKELISNKVLRKVRQNIEKYVARYNPIEVNASYPEFKYKENFFSGLSELPTGGGRLTADGTICYMDEFGEWKQFKN